MIQTKFDLDNYSVQIVIEFSFSLLQVSALLINVTWPLAEYILLYVLDSIADRNLFICSGVILNRHLCFKSGGEGMFVLVPDLIIPVHIFLAALKWEEDWVHIILTI